MTTLSVQRMESSSTRFSLSLIVNVFLVINASQGILIDTGFDDIDNVQSILESVARANVTITGIYLTHYHVDHSLGAPSLARALHCPIYFHQRDEKNLITTWQQANLYTTGLSLCRLNPNLPITVGTEQLDVLETPGHTHGHVSYFHRKSKTLFAGDMVIHGNSVWVGPPDGHMDDYLDSLVDLIDLDPSSIYGGHGPIIAPGVPWLHTLYQRRLNREQQIMILIKQERQTVDSLAKSLYGDRPVQWVTKKTIVAHLQRLQKQKRIKWSQDPHSLTTYYYD